jgi:hypothetical protein
MRRHVAGHGPIVGAVTWQVVSGSQSALVRRCIGAWRVAVIARTFLRHYGAKFQLGRSILELEER